jgi:hypothetical protein
MKLFAANKLITTFCRVAIAALLATLLTTLLTACSNKPSDEELRTQITTYLLKDNRDKLYSVENFKKVNGFQNDERTYTAQVRYDLVFKIDLADATKEIGEEPNKTFLDKGVAALGLLSLTALYGNFKAGDRVTKNEKVVLIKTEKGWRLKDEFLNE